MKLHRRRSTEGRWSSPGILINIFLELASGRFCDGELSSNPGLSPCAVGGVVGLILLSTVIVGGVSSIGREGSILVTSCNTNVFVYKQSKALNIITSHITVEQTVFYWILLQSWDRGFHLFPPPPSMYMVYSLSILT